MQLKWDRLIIAALMSFLCYAGTFAWYRLTSKKNSGSVDKAPVAFITQVSEEVQRKPAKRQIWQLLISGDPVFPGEAVRTSSDGTARLQLADGGRSIDLEPDTLIVISQSNTKDIALDLMDGRLSVEQQEGGDADTSLTLKSGDSVMDLSNATAKLSKGSGDRLDVQVLKGTAQIKDGDKTREIGSGTRGSLGSAGFDVSQLQILSPLESKNHFLEAPHEQPVRFAWKGLPKEAMVRVLFGKNAKELKPLKDWALVPTNSMEWRIQPGSYFWKLEAKMPTEPNPFADGGVDRFKVIRVEAAKELIPEEGSTVRLAQESDAIRFKWKGASSAESQDLQISMDPDFKKIERTEKNLTTDLTELQLKPGSYFWRVLSHYEGKDTPVASKTMALHVSLTSVQLQWTNAPIDNKAYFVGEPKVSLNWKADHPDWVDHYQLKVQPVSEDGREPASDSAAESTTKGFQQTVELKEPGVYIASIEAIDKNGKSIGKLDSQKLSVEVRPLLAAPFFLPKEGELKADNTGRLDLKWEKVTGAQEYWVTLKDANGKEVRKAKFKGDSTALANMLPGNYKLEIYAMDEYGRKSHVSAERPALVPDNSGLQAPKLKKVKVK